MENYNGIGKYRTKEAGRAIDPSGKLPDGTEFKGLNGLRQLLVTSRREDFIAAVTERLLTYALGRGLESYDKPAVRSIVREAARNDYRFSSLILGIVKSDAFQMNRQGQP